MTALLDLLPLIAFFIASKKFGLLAGAAAVLAATLAVYGIHLVRQKWRLTKQQWVVLVLTILFCGATILLRDDLYLRWKTPIINLSFALALAVSALIGKPLMQPVAKDVFRFGPPPARRSALLVRPLPLRCLRASQKPVYPLQKLRPAHPDGHLPRRPSLRIAQTPQYRKRHPPCKRSERTAKPAAALKL